jgi:hypothetical protein
MSTGIATGMYGSDAAAGQITLLATPGPVAGSSYAYQQGVYGSIAPDNIGPREKPILQLFSGNTVGGSSYDFFIKLDDTTAVTQSLFAGVVIEDRTGTLRFYDTASATFSQPPGVEPQWTWGTGSNHLWNSTTARRVIIV